LPIGGQQHRQRPGRLLRLSRNLVRRPCRTVTSRAHWLQRYRRVVRVGPCELEEGRGRPAVEFGRPRDPRMAHALRRSRRGPLVAGGAERVAAASRWPLVSPCHDQRRWPAARRVRPVGNARLRRRALLCRGPSASQSPSGRPLLLSRTWPPSVSSPHGGCGRSRLRRSPARPRAGLSGRLCEFLGVTSAAGGRGLEPISAIVHDDDAAC
jgi:hypothetical protein